MIEKIAKLFKNVSLFLCGYLTVCVALALLKGNQGNAGMFFALLLGFGVFAHIGWSELSTRQKDKLTVKAVAKRALQIGLFSMGAYVFFYSSFLSPSVFNGDGLVFIPVAVVMFLAPLTLIYTELSYWWENVRKLLFFNRVVDVKNYEFLLTFDRKNELLKFVGTIREMDKSKNKKWLALLISLPFITACAITSFVLGTLSALFSAHLCYGVYRLGMAFTFGAYCTLWLTDKKSAEKFFKKRKSA